jgi:pimeloyl-ACP methyl ester carboxylesterase
VQRVCPCITIGHSQAGMFVFTAAQAAPDKVKAVIVVEPASALDPAKFSGANVKHIPHLVVWGDNVATNKFWSTYRNNA